LGDADTQRHTLEEEYASRLQESQKEVERVRGVEEALRSEVEELKKEVATSDSQKEGMGLRVEELEKEVKKREEMVEGEKERAASLEQEKNSLSLTVTNLMNKNDLLAGRVEQIQKEYESLQKSVVETIQENTQQYEKKVEEYRQMVQKMKMESVEKRDGGAIDGDMRLQLEARDQQIQSMKMQLKKKDAEIAELLSYVEEMTKSR
ncbi:hypothetical protein BLSTO_04489, partial [Blastocystis sp. subtype 1]